MCAYDEFIDYYKFKSIVKDFRRDILEYRASGIFIFWVISVIAFIIYSIGAIMKSWASLIFLALRVLVWVILYLFKHTGKDFQTEIILVS